MRTARPVYESTDDRGLVTEITDGWSFHKWAKIEGGQDNWQNF